MGHPSPQADAARAAAYQGLIGEAKAFPGATELLAQLRREGVAVVLATSSPTDEFETVVHLVGGVDAMDGYTTADDVDETKPAPEVFHAALRAGDIDPEWAIVVGDSVWDVQAARAAGLACVGVETGGFSAHELREEGAVRVYRDVAELLAQLRSSPIQPLLDRTAASF